MARPGVLCKLQKGVLIDACPGFVETFNYLVDFVENLKGEGEINLAKSLKIDRAVPDRPVIRGGGGGAVDITCIGEDGSETSVTGATSIKFVTDDDSDIRFSVAQTDGVAVVTVGVRYK